MFMDQLLNASSTTPVVGYTFTLLELVTVLRTPIGGSFCAKQRVLEILVEMRVPSLSEQLLMR